MTGKQDGFQQRDDFTMEAFCGVDEGEVDSHGVGAPIGAVAEDEFSEDDRVTEGLFRIVIGWWHAVNVEESKEPVVVAFWIQESLAKVFGFRVLARHFADAVKRRVKRRDIGLRLEKGKLMDVPEASDFTGVAEEDAHLIAKPQIAGVLPGLWQ